MTDLYPLRFNPVLKEKVWGSDLLMKGYGKKTPGLIKAGESWEISGLPGDESVVSNGFLEGNNLNELLEVYMGDIVGESVYEKFGDEFPVLVKFVNAAADLSVQVHPNNEIAGRLHHAWGKSEMWHILSAEKGSVIYCGFKNGIGREEYHQALHNGSLHGILNCIEVTAGESYWIPAGTIHAIGKGIVIAEIQQTSDITYRIFDWNRADSGESSRELHTELAEEALNFISAQKKIEYINSRSNQTRSLIKSDYFNVNIIKFNNSVKKDYTLLDSFVILVCTEGQSLLYWENGTEKIIKGESILIPATIGYISLEPVPECTILEIYIDIQPT
jgi:mannose-6-phosphate isomerase